MRATSDKAVTYLDCSLSLQQEYFIKSYAEQWRSRTSPLALVIDGYVDLPVLELAISDLLVRHEPLRTVFPLSDGMRHQRIILHPDYPKLQVIESNRKEVAVSIQRQGSIGFDIDRELPLRAHIYRLKPNSHILLLTSHPLAIDAWSVRPIVCDLLSAYHSRLAGSTPEWPDLPITYREYAFKHRSDRGPTSRLAAQEDYWQTTLEPLMKRLQLPHTPPSSSPRDFTRAQQMGCRSLRLNAGIHRSLISLAGRLEADLSTVFHGVLAAVLAGYQPHRVGMIPMGGIVSGRTDQRLLDLVGFFANVIILQAEVTRRTTFRELIRSLRAANVEAYSSQDVPLCCLLEAARLPAFGRSGWFPQVVLSVQRAPVFATEESDLDVRARPLPATPVDSELTFDFIESISSSGLAEGIEGRIAFDSGILQPDDVESIVADFLYFLEGVSFDPDRPIDLLERGTSEPASSKIPIDSLEAQTPRNGVPRMESGEGKFLAPYTPLHHLLAMTWGAVLGIRRIGVRDTFGSLEGNRALAEPLVDKIAEVLHRRVPLTIVSEGLTIESLAHELLRELPAGPVIEIQAGDRGRKPPLFFLHGDFSGGGLYAYGLARELGLDQPFYLLQQHGLDGGSVPESIELMARDQLKRLKAFCDADSFYLGGYCSGALIAYEMARLLSVESGRYPLLILIDAPFLDSTRRSPQPLRKDPPADWRESPAQRNGWLFSLYAVRLGRYTPGFYDGDVLLFWARNHVLKGPDSRLAWAAVAPKLHVYTVPGDHITCVTRHVGPLGSAIVSALEGSRGDIQNRQEHQD